MLVQPIQVAFYNCNAHKCNLIGNWTNELGSNMTIVKPTPGTIFTGSYFTAVTVENGTVIKESFLYGAEDDQHSDQPVFGFVVNWSFTVSISDFIGQCFVDGEGVEKLETMWLLRAKADSSGDNWKATRVGSNLFFRPNK
ncbi:avidin-like [Huso huso]|uniref:Avidin-like n=2 Tax=Huso huso TaxID=61971 RepID=A0ABR0Z4S3_HUSHU